MELPFSQACENNKDPILALISNYFNTPGRVLEIGGGTGQHATYFASNMPWLVWQSSDVPESVATLNLRLTTAALSNLPPAIALDVTQDALLLCQFDYLFSANTLHIMPESAVTDFFKFSSRVLLQGGILAVYGPFKYSGKFTSASNADFDLRLKNRNPVSGIRDFEHIASLAKSNGLQLLEDYPMPANNQMLIWRLS
jgi:SAM-dependent methyltransferase